MTNRFQELRDKEVIHVCEGARLGYVNDLVVDANGAIKSMIIGVGGFLGVAKKDVAILFNSLNITYDADNTIKKISAEVTKDELKSAPDYSFLKKS